MAYTHNPRLSSQQKRKLEFDLANLGEWPENEMKRRHIKRQLQADIDAQERDKKKRRHVRSR